VGFAVNRSTGQTVAGYSALTHQRVLHVIEELDDAALSEGSGRASSIGFQLVANRSLGLQAQIAMHVATRATGQHQPRVAAAKVRLADAE